MNLVAGEEPPPVILETALGVYADGPEACELAGARRTPSPRSTASVPFAGADTAAADTAGARATAWLAS